VRFVIEGPPRTKKNSSRILRGRSGKSFVAPSAQAKAWEESAILQIKSQAWAQGRFSLPLQEQVGLCALIYREKDIGDLLNYLAAVSDALERAGVVDDDRLIMSLDGSRLLVDKVRPRVEIEVLPCP
jgi:Holliday junction resolvase RusA-like endonuclease